MFLLDAPVSAAYSLVNGLSDALTPVAGELAATAAIIICTLAVRSLLIPLAIRAAKGERARTLLMPKIQKLQKRYAKNPQRLQQETLALYRAEGVSMFAGMGPAFAQAPFFMVLYRVFMSATIAGHQNLLLGHTLLAAPLGQNWMGVLGMGVFSAPSLTFLALLVLLAAVAWWTSSRVTAEGPMGRVARAMPFGTVVFAAFVPLAAGVYLLTSTTWTAVERAVLHRRIIAPA
ncbi:YidC/Oxa1 family membrane protein insertase [Actinomadura hibisca]|uniref:YidC/Oxa1 family membrane protein insertase n=1 Tax=Actinomadura hibisca TaxID=68565 RepID=UPI0008372121|nr:YidC/Oxa1 family membrane protein insertase [Actinomadura hibisca]